MSHCRSCEAPIIRAETVRGEYLALDAWSCPEGTVEIISRGARVPLAVIHTQADLLGSARHTEHSQTCVAAKVRT